MKAMRRRETLVVGAHPDDEALAAAGPIARRFRQGDRLSVLIVTDGVTARGWVTGPQNAAARSACMVLGAREKTLGKAIDPLSARLAIASGDRP